jgi:hypothetical protein
MTMTSIDIINPPPTLEEEYTSNMIAPVYDDFYRNPFRRTYEDLMLYILVKCDVYASYYMSDSYIQKMVEESLIKKEAKIHKQKKMQKIKTTVQSYRAAFQRFNTPSRPTCFDQMPDGELIRGRINCKTNRAIKSKTDE